jgi:hypothetical protein
MKKSMKVKNRDELGKQIADGLNKFFCMGEQHSQEWIVLMSSHIIRKTRRGFILRNQQLSKSRPEITNDAEADGTILAVKIHKNNRSIIIPAWKNELALNNDVTTEYMFCSSDDSTSITPTITEGEALKFEKDVEQAVNSEYEPTEKIFIDHSVLYSKLSSLEKYVSNDMTESPLPNNGNLIVLNLGSMVNAGSKNWNLVHRNKLEEIKMLDEKLYKIFKENNVFYNSNKSTELLHESYEEFNGAKKFYNPEITPEDIKNIKQAIGNMTLEIAQPTSSGGRKSRKSRKLRKSRKPRKSRKLRRR